MKRMGDQDLTPTEFELALIFRDNFVIDGWYSILLFAGLAGELCLMRYGVITGDGLGFVCGAVMLFWLGVFVTATTFNMHLLGHIEIGEGQRVCEWCRWKPTYYFLMFHHHTRDRARHVLERIRRDPASVI